MKSAVRAAFRLLTWLAVLWTIYEEQRHLGLYLGDPEIAFGAGEYIDIPVTLLLLGYAVYEVLHFARATAAFDRYLATHPAVDALTIVLLAALGWGIYRDLGHFQHLYLGAEGTLPFGENFDQIAAVLLVLGVIKTGYHAAHAIKALARLGRSKT
jgi:hypothetical protein